MIANPQLQREYDRWYPLLDIPSQRSLVEEKKRFPVVVGGRRSGKTERAKRFIVKTALANPNRNYICAAPTYNQAKKIFWDDLKLLSFSSTHPKSPSESELIIYLPNGSNIYVMGLERPERVEGRLIHGMIIDEIADIKETAWQSNIYPALNTVHPTEPSYRAFCWLTGVPNLGVSSLYYDLAMYAQSANDPDWGYYHWTTAEIFPEMAAEAKKVMSEKQYKVEFEASFETVSGRIYEDYGNRNHTDRVIQPHEQLMFMHDFNYTPLSSAIGVRENDNLYLLDEIILTSAVAKQSALEFVEKFKNHKNRHVLLYGDPAGRAGEKHGHDSDYTDMEGVLRSNGWNVERRVKKKHPAIKDRQNAVRKKILTANGNTSLFVNPKTAEWCDKGLRTVQLKKGSTFQEEQADNDYQHITTAIGYCVDYEWANDTLIFTNEIGYAL